MDKIVAIVMAKNNISKEEATKLVNECRDLIYDGANAKEVLKNKLGLEPDYVSYII